MLVSYVPNPFSCIKNEDFCKECRFQDSCKRKIEEERENERVREEEKRKKKEEMYKIIYENSLGSLAYEDGYSFSS